MAVWLQILLGVLSVVAASASAIAAFLVWDIAKRQSDPKILVTVEQIQVGSIFYGVVLRNIGSSTAFGVSATVDTKYRPVDESGLFGDLCNAFTHKWSMLAPGQDVSFHLNRDKVWAERESNAELIVEVQYSKKFGKQPKHREKFDVKPSWKNGQLMSGPSIWREIDTRLRPIVDTVHRSERQLANIAHALDKDNEQI